MVKEVEGELKGEVYGVYYTPVKLESKKYNNLDLPKKLKKK